MAAMIYLVMFVPPALILLQAFAAATEVITTDIISSLLPANGSQHQKQSLVRDTVAEGDVAVARALTTFWASTGLCPPEPRNASGTFLLSQDTRINLELIASLTNGAVRHVRVHWLLELLKVSLAEGRFQYNFTELDAFLDHLNYIGLYPGFELMGVPLAEFEMQPLHSEHFWTDLVQQLVVRYSHRYGSAYVAGWRFETWNEPDLKSYNTLNFSVDGYLTYVKAIRNGLDSMAGKYTSHGDETFRLGLYGPAGLFKAEAHHPLCWAVISLCNSAQHRCPFDTITFHRKGSGRWASEVVSGGRQLMADIFSRLPNVRRLQFANDEADPIAGWSTGRAFQADVRYAAMLFSIVAQHWAAMADAHDSFGRHFEFLSNDNAFLAYHPYEFEQRTLLARFQMNETDPPHVQFVAKPVYSALGMLAHLGPLATRTRFRPGNVSYIVSTDERSPPSYICLLASRSNDSFPLLSKRSLFNVSISLDIFKNRSTSFDMASYGRVSYLIESLQDGLNDPFRVWQWQGKPAYPSTAQLAAMRAVQFPTVLNRGGVPQTVLLYGNATELQLSLSLRAPWLVSVRVCNEKPNAPNLLVPVQRLRVRTVFKGEVLIFWMLPGEHVRCIQTYEVWFKPSPSLASEESCPWRLINARQHTPFTVFQYATDTAANHVETSACSGVVGYYKVRAIDMFDRAGPFSSVVHYNVLLQNASRSC